MKKNYGWLVLIALVLTCEKLLAQEEPTDSTRVLDEVVIQAYRSDRPLSEVPVSIGVVTEKELNRFSNTSLLPAVNMVPGVRMEERSPGSYRLSIRGSVLRSPFGVRNVKFYWKGLPLTDGGGNTYLNLLDFTSIGNMEIIKGPGASLYGAGTGGVVLLDPPKFTRKMNLDYSMLAGTFSLLRFQVGGTVVASSKSLVAIRLAYQKSNGYREQTNMSRFVAQADWDFAINNKNTLSTTVLTSDLDYQTPGGLTLTQFEQDPHQARPAGGPFRGAVEQKAAVSNRTVYVGTMLEHDWNDTWSTRVGLFGSGTLFENPTIRNYEIREEQNWGGRTETQVHFGGDPVRGKITFGGEFQQFFSPLAVYDNDQGTKGNLQTDDYLKSTTGLFFVQTELDLPYQFFLTLGGSANFLKYDFKRLNVSPQANQERKFEPGFFPRVALLKKLFPWLSLYGSLSNGFSAPSLEEVRPSTGSFVNGVTTGFNSGLNPEHGSNMELGIRLNETKSQLQFDLAAYRFRLKETIVIQRAADGGDYFVNAGTTDQRGLEATFSWTPRLNAAKWNDLRLWVSYTMNDYHFKDYVNDGNDYSGNMITGVAPYVFVAGLSLETKRGWYALVTFNHTDRIPLNDANSVFASEYELLGARVGKKLKIKKLQLDLFVGIDNAFDERYSLGNDLNAAGARYYNAAAPRNYYAGLAFPLFPK